MLNSSSAVVVLQRGREQRLARHEHDDDVGRRLEVRPVALVAEPVDVVLHLPRVVPQLRVARRVVFAVHRVEVRGQRHLGVDDDVLAARELDDGVGRQAAFLGADGLLDLEVHAFEEARALEDPAQLDLAPLAADVRGAQRARELAGFGVQDLLCLRQRAQLFGELRLRAGAAAIDVDRAWRRPWSAIRAAAGQRVDRLLPSVEVHRGGLLELAERCSREAQERLAVLLAAPPTTARRTRREAWLRRLCSRASFSAECAALGLERGCQRRPAPAEPLRARHGTCDDIHKRTADGAKRERQQCHDQRIHDGRSLGERSANLKSCMMESVSISVVKNSVRFSRHLTAGRGRRGGAAAAQEAARVLCVGAGGLGSPAALYLAAAGVGTIGLVDFDVVDFSNLQRQVLYTTGRRRPAEARSRGRARCEALNPRCTSNRTRVTLDASNAQALVSSVRRRSSTAPTTSPRATW